MEFPLRVQAWAKINLYFEILGRRTDGFHEIYSIFSPIDWADKLEFFPLKRKELILECSDPAIENKKNLVLRAARLLEPYQKTEAGVHIRLEKNVPYGAGLGSASSDGAAVLKTLNRLWECGLSEEKLRELALGIGSDMPFFLQNSPCEVTGSGESLRPLSKTEIFFILVLKPRKHSISTAEAYGLAASSRAYTDRGKNREEMLRAFTQGKAEDLASQVFNGFESVLIPRYGFLKEMKEIFRKMGALNSVLSGSGSAMTGIFSCKESLNQGIRYLEEKFLTNFFDFRSLQI